MVKLDYILFICFLNLLSNTRLLICFRHPCIQLKSRQQRCTGCGMIPSNVFWHKKEAKRCEEPTAFCDPGPTLSTRLSVQTQSVMSALLGKERPPEVLRNTSMSLWTVHTCKASQSYQSYAEVLSLQLDSKLVKRGEKMRTAVPKQYIYIVKPLKQDVVREFTFVIFKCAINHIVWNHDDFHMPDISLDFDESKVVVGGSRCQMFEWFSSNCGSLYRFKLTECCLWDMVET